MRLASRPHVVVVLDELGRLRSLVPSLSSSGFEVSHVRDSQAVLEIVECQRPLIVVIDGQTSETQAQVLCSTLRQRYGRHELYLLMLTALGTSCDVPPTSEQGADDFITSPVQATELLTRLRAGLRVLELHQELRQARNSAAATLEALAARADEIAATRDVAVFALAKLAESRDPETGEHLERLRCYSQILAEQLNQEGPYRDLIDERFLEDLYRSSPLHDIGKVGIPDAILRKPGKLTPEEFEIMKQHTTIGADALEQAMHLTGCGGFLAMAVEIARFHHERFDGTGYPTRLKAHDIPLPARIVALADVYDALTSVRIYKDAYSAETARQMILEQEGLHFDPVVVEAFRTRFVDFLAVRDTIDGRHDRQAIGLAG